MNLFAKMRAFRRGVDANPLRKHFNDAFYLARYSDVRASGIDPWDHYVRFGLSEDRQPRGDFDPAFYRAARKSAIGLSSPFHHWVAVGRAKGWRGHPWIDKPDFDELGAMRAEFDAAHYLARHPSVAQSNIDPFDHFILHGWRQNCDPTAWFSIQDYLELNPEVGASGLNPFSHYVVVGRAEGRPTKRADGAAGAPEIDQFEYDIISSEFDTELYLSQLGAEEPQPADAVAHFILEGAHRRLDPNNWFSCARYLANNPDVLEAGVNPFFHYLCQGRHEMRDSAPVAQTASVAPAIVAGPDAGETFEQHLAFSSRGPNYEILDPGILRSRAPKAKLIVYYLPQFHAIAENDAWWGLGFTEWRNIVRGQPRFRGHQQPRIPEALGFYDLADSEIMRRQARMAKSAGVHAFCFYYYNFNGRRILEKPIEAYLADKSVDIGFALMWANENWTRTWDGEDRSVLLAQEYDTQNDPAFLDDVARHFADSRYIRIDGRPLFFVYRPGLIPDAKARFADWRVYWRKEHGENPLLFMAQGFDDIDPRVYDLDGAIEFPPHKVAKNAQPINQGLQVFDPDFTGHVVSYSETVERSLREPTPEFPLIKTAVPSWDNEARRPGRGMTLHGATPALYERWLRALVDFSGDHPVHGERFVAVNAWNEWAEGAYLEPDVYHGAAFLNATARALTAAPERTALARHQILFVGHDAYQHGAQILVRNLIEVFNRQFGFRSHIVVCGGGPLLEDYRRMTASCATVQRRDVKDGAALARRLAEQGVRRAIINTTVSGWIAPLLRKEGFRVASLIHELPTLIGKYKLELEAKAIADSADVTIFPAALVRDSFLEISGPPRGDVMVRPQGLYREDIRAVLQNERDTIRDALDLPRDAKIVINVGYADIRKGFDVFLRAARVLCAKRADVHFIWVGAGTPDATRWQMADIAAVGLADRVRMTGFTDRVADYYAVADAFFFTSREDPFPSVVLEALAAGLPVVAARGNCGTNDLVEIYGRLVDFADEAGQVQALEAAFRAPRQSATAGVAAMRTQFRFDEYCFDLARTVYPDLPKVSVVVPNYNYARYIDARLCSIFRQTHPVFEVVVLDDMSTDESLETITEVAEREGRKIELVANAANSGSVFRQWRKGVEQARGDYVWLAEADDDCDETFLQTLLTHMVRDNATFGFSDSWQVGSFGERLGDSYRSYLSEEAPGAFEASFSMDGREFLGRFLSVKNVILNVSGVVFHRRALLEAMDALGDGLYGYKVAGDWRLYVELCAREGAVIAYEAAALNGHRRHQSSVTHSLNAAQHFAEITEVQVRAEKLVGELPTGIEKTRRIYRAKVSEYLGLPQPHSSEKN